MKSLYIESTGLRSYQMLLIGFQGPLWPRLLSKPAQHSDRGATHHYSGCEFKLISCQLDLRPICGKVFQQPVDGCGVPPTIILASCTKGIYPCVLYKSIRLYKISAFPSVTFNVRSLIAIDVDLTVLVELMMG